MMMMPIHIDGSVDDALTILLGVEKLNHFTPDFKEYIRNERLNWSRFDGDPNVFGDPTLGWVFWSQLDNFADSIRQAIQKLISKTKLDHSLVQFWAATKTSEGRTLLTTQFQPFALGSTNWPRSISRNRLCEYRMGMCREYNNSFYADAECAQELLGLPGRVFLNKLPESTPDVKYYTLKEYPQRNLALHCEINESLALPVFGHSSRTCVGVLEIVSRGFEAPFWNDKSILGQMYDIFQEAGLQCFDGYKHSELQVSGMNVISEDQNIPRLEAVQNGEVTMQLDSSHQPPLDPLNNGQNVVIAERNIIIVTSSEECKRETQKEHKGTGVKIEVPLEDILKCAKMSRKGAAEKLQVSVSTLKRVCRHHRIHRWPPRNIEELHSFRLSPVENEGQTRQRLNSDLPLNQDSDNAAHPKPAFQDADMVTIKAKYENNTIKFRLSLPSRLVALQQEVANRLNLEAGTYYVRYEDEENDLILIACDQDLQDCIDTFKSLGKTSVVVQLEPK